MSLSHSLKQAVRRLLTRCDLGIYRLHHAEMDAIDHNRVGHIDEHYASTRTYPPEVRAERTRFLSSVLALIESRGVPLAGRSVADVGCGTGDLLALVANRGGATRLTGYESSEVALREAASTCPSAELRVADLTAGITDRHGVVFCLEVLEHLMDPDGALKNLLRMLEPGGHLIVTVPDARFDNFGGHVNFWGPVGWRRFLLSHVPENRLLEGQLPGEFRINYAVISSALD